MGVRAEGRATLAATLRTLRRSAGLTQERLAEQSGVSVRTICNIEIGRVTSPRVASIGALADALDVDGVERERLHELSVGEDHDPASVVADGRGRLPTPLTRLVGRAGEVAALTEAISARAGRLLTLTGVAGVGKTRLAIEVVRQLEQRGWRAWWVPLASIGDTRYVIDAIAKAVGASEVSLRAVAARLGSDATVLALDNLEHIDGVGEVLAELLTRSSSTTVLATSVAPVCLHGEQEWLVRPLPVPAEHETELRALASVSSVELLVERVRAGMPDFELTSASGRVVAEICRLLDGLPLAVELAAEQWRVRGDEGLVSSIRREPLGLRDISDAAPQQHASLLNALEASYALLTEGERHTFASLAVFPAGWDVDAAAFVADSEATVDHLDRLVGLGLVVSSAPNSIAEPRFSMLPTIRAFATTRAEEDGTAEAIAARHAEYFHSWSTGLAAAAELETERDNLRVALHWFRSHDPRAGLGIASNLYTHWREHGREEEGLAQFEGLLDRVDDLPVAGSAPLAKAQQQAAVLAYVTGAHQQAARRAERSLALYGALGDLRGCAEARGTLGMATLPADPHAALAHCRTAVALAEQLDDGALLGWLLERLAICLGQLGRLPEASAAVDRAVALASEHQVTDRRTQAMLLQAYHEMMQGDFVAADHILEACAPLVTSPHEASLEVFWLQYRAVNSALLGKTDRAADHLEALSEIAVETGSKTFETAADLALAELRYATGASDEAAATLRRIVVRPMFRMPLNRITVLALLSLAAADLDTAASAVSAAERIADRLALRMPPVPAARLAAARDRWIDAVGPRAWDDRAAACSSQTLEALLHDLATS